MLAEVVLPPLPAKTGTSYKQISRQRGSATQSAIASVVTLDDKGKISNLRMVMMSVGATPLTSMEAEKILIGQEPTEAAIKEVAQKASETEIDPSSDMHASADYRRHATCELIIQSLSTAVARAKGKEG
jgi:CO/xanthine dehydrogenase FAD-binding subunit